MMDNPNAPNGSGWPPIASINAWWLVRGSLSPPISDIKPTPATLTASIIRILSLQHKLLKLHNAVELRVPGDCDSVHRDGNLNTRLHLEVTPTAR